jgi:hypothetical protein
VTGYVLQREGGGASLRSIEAVLEGVIARGLLHRSDCGPGRPDAQVRATGRFQPRIRIPETSLDASKQLQPWSLELTITRLIGDGNAIPNQVPADKGGGYAN